ncbi:hypothetical protein VTI74DRAFT_4550 [Chaetomium olivicolor]
MGVIQAAADVVDYAQREFDRAVPPESRQKAYFNAKEYATRQPLLFSFVVAQILFAAAPILLFLFFVLSTLFFAFGCAVLFTLFWIGVALFVLVPTLLVGATVGFCVWASAAAFFVASRWGVGVLMRMADAATRELGDPSTRPNDKPTPTPRSLSTPTGWAEIRDRDVKREDGAGRQTEGKMGLAVPEASVPGA